MKTSLVIILLFFASLSVNAQVKLAYYNADSLVSFWPEYQKVLDTLVSISVGHQQKLTIMQSDYSIKEMKLNEDSASLTRDEVAARRQAMVDLDSAYVRYIRYATQDMKVRKEQMAARLNNLLIAAARKVATAKGIELVEEKLDALDMVAVAGTNYQLIDITPEVMAELGIPVKNKKKRNK